MKKAIILTRIATTTNTKCPNSIEQQKKLCLDYCEKFNYKVVNIIELSSVSGLCNKYFTIIKRIIDQNNPDVLVVASIDRLSRNILNAHKILSFLEDNSVDLEIVGISSQIEFHLELLDAMDNYDRNIRSERIKAGIRRKKKLTQ